MVYALGIDVGTSYSAAATAREGRVEIFQLGERAATIPSVVVVRADGEVLTGDAAERRSLAEPTRTAREFKRRLGDPIPIIIGGTPYSAEALMAHQLRAIMGRVTEELGERPVAIVVTHPASYGAYKIDLLELAIRQAGIANATLLTEPEAAAVQYARRERVPTGAVVAVYDFGGVSFEATILRKTEDGFEQVGRPEGIERLGGIDFDEAIFNRVMTMVRSSGIAVDLEDPATLAAIARLREECRRAKEALSFDTDASVAVMLPGLQTDIRLTREQFEDMIRPRIDETIWALMQAVKSADVDFEGVDRILLVGGTSRIPLVAEVVREATGRPVAVDAHPKHAMALGAAFVAETRRLDRSRVTAAAAHPNPAFRPPRTPEPSPVIAASAGDAAAVSGEPYHDYAPPSPRPPPAAARPSIGLGRIVGGVVGGIAGGVQAVADAARAVGERVRQAGASPGGDAAKPVINTGLSRRDQPDIPLDPDITLAAGSDYLFWIEIAPPIMGSIEEQPIGAPQRLVAAEALLDVVLFDVSGPPVVIAGSDEGKLKLLPDGSAIVVRQPSGQAGPVVSAALLARRLLFPLRQPTEPGEMRFRCNLYHSGVLIQSRLVRCEVRRAPARSPGAIRSRLDYLLARTLAPDRLAGAQPHELSVLVNDNEDGTHGFYFASGKGRWKRRATFDADALQAYLDQARGALRLAAWGTDQAWRDEPYLYDGEANRARLLKDLIPICTRGYAFYSEMIDRLAGTDEAGESKAEELTALMRAPGSVQIALLGTPRSVVPAALIYDYDLDTGASLASYTFCEQFLEDLAKPHGLRDSICFAGSCPNREGNVTVICPSGLVGIPTLHRVARLAAGEGGMVRWRGRGQP